MKEGTEVSDECNLNLTDHTPEATKKLQGKKTVTCQICLQLFSGRQSYARHIKNATTIQLKCKICLQCFCNKQSYTRHMFAHRNNKSPLQLQCDICLKRFLQGKGLKYHLTHCHPENSRCSATGKSNTEIDNVGKYTSRKTFKCTTCSKSFNKKYTLIRHMKTHSNAKPYECEICSEKYKYKREFQSHLKSVMHITNSEIRKEVTSGSINHDWVNILPERRDSGNKESREYNLDPTLAERNTGIKEEFNPELGACVLEGKESDNIEEITLEEYSRLYFKSSEDKNTKISVVEVKSLKEEVDLDVTLNENKEYGNIKGVAESGEYQLGILSSNDRIIGTNIKIKTEEEEFDSDVASRRNGECEVEVNKCDLDYLSVNDRNVEANSDVSMNSGRNELSNVSLADSINNTKVMRNESSYTIIAEKTYKCKICMKHFNQKHSLNIHLRKYEDQNPFKCKYCFKLFCEKLSYDRHIVNKHKSRLFMCSACSKCFIDKQMLAQHTKTHTHVMKHECEICSKTYKSKKSLTRHRKSLQHIKNLNNREEVAKEPGKCDSEISSEDIESGMKKQVVSKSRECVLDPKSSRDKNNGIKGKCNLGLKDGLVEVNRMYSEISECRILIPRLRLE